MDPECNASGPLAECMVWRYRGGAIQEEQDVIVVEEPLEIRLSGEPFQVLMRTPGMERELALGFLYTEGIVRSLSDVMLMHFCGTATDPVLPPNVIDVTLTPSALERRGRRHVEVAYSSCGLCAKEAVEEIRLKVPPVTSTLTMDLEDVLPLLDRLTSTQPTFQKTGATHGVALASPDGSFFLSAEDVGRHNAMDKAIGRALFERRDLGRMVALLSGRCSSEIALKAIRAGIPILAGVSAPTSMALQLAEVFNLTLVGFARNNRFNVYCHRGRLTSRLGRAIGGQP
jgi:FdhD protein